MPPSQFENGSALAYVGLILAGTVLLGLLPPWLFLKFRKPGWKSAETGGGVVSDDARRPRSHLLDHRRRRRRPLRRRADHLQRREGDRGAQQKAQELTQKFEQAGLRVPQDQDIIVRSLGDDGGAVCENPGQTRWPRRSSTTSSSTAPAFVGRRPVIVDRRVVLGEALILETYCPEELEEFRETRSTTQVRRHDQGLEEHRCRLTICASAVAGLMGRARDDLAELVAFRSVADPKQYPPEECEKAAQWVVDAFTEVGLAGRRRRRRRRTAARRCTATRPGPRASPTVLLYSHYDVQPPLGEDAWTSPVWELTERDGRWYGRGAADCKGNIVMHLTALRALRQVNGGFPCAVKLICEGSEEQGTGGLEAFVPPRTPTCCAPTRSSSSTPATSPSACRR